MSRHKPKLNIHEQYEDYFTVKRSHFETAVAEGGYITFGTSYEDLLVCVGCGDPYGNHVDEVSIGNSSGNGLRVSAQGEDKSTRIVTETRKLGSDRRHTITLHCWCDACGTFYDISFQQHKGTTIVQSKPGDPLEYLKESCHDYAKQDEKESTNVE